MIYSLLSWINGIALHWFYRDIRVIGTENIPTDAPLLIACNHQNALVDSLIVAWVVRRRVTMTAKATLVKNPLIALMFRILGVVPLRRVSDEVRNSDGSTVNRFRNAEAFQEILDVLQDRGAVLIFPEGKSHNESGLEPLKSGMARLALQARDKRSIERVAILPVGLVFEDKGVPGTIAGVRIGKPIEMDSWPTADHVALTEEIAKRLRGMSEESELPLPERNTVGPTKTSLRERLITLAASWGRLTHQFPIRIARDIAVKRSTDADQPAMLTIMFGIGLVLLTYAIHLAVLGMLVHSFWIGCLYLATLLSGAYWAAFEQHPRRY
ncbi:MAG TPA: lysophospholipid acyltransferase family protein [Gemmatimonadaceae bacterium]|nr:lysophospholipid acyltransferase family protein [Gemmatimonadaceae bacterium]